MIKKLLLQIVISIMTEKSFKYQWQPHIVALGRPPGALKAFLRSPKALHFNEGQGQDQKTLILPPNIRCSNNILAIIDQKGSLWVVGSIFYEPINISEIVRIKAKKVFLGEGQLLLETKRRSLVLVTWASKPEFKNEKLRKITLSGGQYSHLFDAYFVEENIEQESLWYYSAANKLEYTVKLYQLDFFGQEMVGFPSGKRTKIPSRPAGMSLGRYHGLVWTQQGKLYSWGCKNLALGLKIYTKSFYEELQEIQLPEPIIKACALTSYSVALGASGRIYEWGMKHEREPFLAPALVEMNGLRFVQLKNSEQYCGGLTSTNELYVWGRGISQVLGEEKGDSKARLIEKADGTKIVDYQLQDNYLVLVLSHDKGELNAEERKYFTEVINKVTDKWMPARAKSKQSNATRPQKRKYLTPTCTPPSAKENEDYIDRLVGEKISKETYFSSMQNQEMLFKKLMNHSTPQLVYTECGYRPPATSREPRRLNRTHKKVESTKDTAKVIIDFQNANRILKDLDDQKKQVRAKSRKLRVPTANQNHKLTSYEERKEAAEERRQDILKRKADSAAAKRRTMIKSEQIYCMQDEDYLKVVKDHLIKSILVKFLKEPLLFAKHIKLKQRRSQQTFNKIASNMKNILGRQRAIHFLKILEEQHPGRFYLMKRVIGGAMRRWKQNKVFEMRKKVVSTIVCSALKTKVAQGLGRVWLKARKLQKCAKWLNIQQLERYSHLRSLWKKTLLLYIKPTPSFQNKNPVNCRQELNFKTLSEKNKCPKLRTYLHHSAICHLELPFPVPLSLLEHQREQSLMDHEPSMHRPLSMKKGVSWAQASKLEWKNSTFHREQKRSTHYSQNGMIDILLYSHHYDSFFKPKNCQLNIPDNMKLSDKWVMEQKTIFEKLLKDIMHEQWRQFWFARIEYELKLALFIRDHYDRLAEFRWKYILQYNQIKKMSSAEAAKKERELERILRIVGAESLLTKDVIPQKHRTLDFISKINGAPVAPVYETRLGTVLFKKQFKNYYERVLERAKQIRRFFN